MLSSTVIAAPSYDTGSGLLQLPELHVGSNCYDVALRTVSATPITLELLTADKTGCSPVATSIFNPSNGQLFISALAVGNSCYDLGLNQISSGPIRMQLATSGASSCQTKGIVAPTAPSRLVVTAGNALASLAFEAPADNGGAKISGYTATCLGAGSTVTASGSSSPIVMGGLINGTLYSCSVTASNVGGSSGSSVSVSVTTVGAVSSFALTSSAGVDGGVMGADYTCDGTGSTIDLAWSGVPAGTRSFALLMTTLPADGNTKWNWVLYDIPANLTKLAKDSFGIGTLGVGSDGPMAAYQPPCSQGPGAKLYTWTLYALSDTPVLSVAPAKVTGDILASAISRLMLGSAKLNLSFTRTTLTGSATGCFNIRSSMLASTTGYATVSCDSNYAYVSSMGIPTHSMMNGIIATNLQVPTIQNFQGANGWKIPLAPTIAASTTTAVDGPIGIAINGVPIFNPCKQGGCQNGDTKVQGELDACNGHAGRADDYHYHAAPVCMMAARPGNYWDTHPLGWALDGFAIYGYNNADGSVAARDAVCGGNTSAVSNGPAGYSYHVTDASPYVLSCFRGTPSPDLTGQAAKFHPMRQPPVTPFAVSGMSLSVAADGYEELEFTSAKSFAATETGSDSYANSAGTYKIRYKQASGTDLQDLLSQSKNSGKTACWVFQFINSSGTVTQPAVSYCR